MNKKITTIDELAAMINKSFVGIESRMGSLEARMENMETRLAGQIAGLAEQIAAQGERIEKIEQRLAALEVRFNSFEKYAEGRFDELSREVKEIKNQLKAADTREAVVSLEVRVDKIERKLNLGA